MNDIGSTITYIRRHLPILSPSVKLMLVDVAMVAKEARYVLLVGLGEGEGGHIFSILTLITPSLRLAIL